MSKDKRQGWIKELQVGDKVVVSDRRWQDSIQRVTAITPSGRIRVTGYSCVFAPSGTEMSVGTWSKRMQLAQYTEEDNARIHKEMVYQALRRHIPELGRNFRQWDERQALANVDGVELEELLRSVKKLIKKMS